LWSAVVEFGGILWGSNSGEACDATLIPLKSNKVQVLSPDQ
jgi:hypothetical protein